MTTPQPNILSFPRSRARLQIYSLHGGAKAAGGALRALQAAVAERDEVACVVGFGEPLVRALGADIPGLRTFPALSGPGVAVPSTQGALLLAVHGDDQGVILHAARAFEALLEQAFDLQEATDTFTYREGRDLTGYVDGTENPEGDDAAAAAIVQAPEALSGGTFVAVQRWVHDLDTFEERSPRQRDHTIGRSLETDEELDDAPATAHVKRAEQEAYDPPAFMLRRSMPYADADGEGLVFIAYGHSLDAYERVLSRMLGRDDGLVDALFGFSEPMTGGYYFCPPLVEDRIDLRALLG